MEPPHSKEAQTCWRRKPCILTFIFSSFTSAENDIEIFWMHHRWRGLSAILRRRVAALRGDYESAPLLLCCGPRSRVRLHRSGRCSAVSNGAR